MTKKFGEGTSISIHGPRGGPDKAYVYPFILRNISIHGPRGGPDIITSSNKVFKIISIHGPRGGPDWADHACADA